MNFLTLRSLFPVFAFSPLAVILNKLLFPAD